MAAFELLILVCACAVSLAADADPAEAPVPAPSTVELQEAPTRLGYDVYEHDRHRDDLWSRNRYNLVPWVDPTKGVRAHGHSHEAAIQNEIVRWVHHPTYYQPIVAVDYRFLKTGRAYTRGRGGQVLVLPYGNEVNAHNSYDKLLENPPGPAHDLDLHERHREDHRQRPVLHDLPQHRRPSDHDLLQHRRPIDHDLPQHRRPSDHGLPYGRRNEGQDWLKLEEQINLRGREADHGLGLGAY